MLSSDEALVILFVIFENLVILAVVLLGVYVAVRFAVKHGVLSAYEKLHGKKQKEQDLD